MAKSKRVFEGSVRAAVEFGKIGYKAAKWKDGIIVEPAAAVCQVTFYGPNARGLLAALAEFADEGPVTMEANVYRELLLDTPASAQVGPGTTEPKRKSSATVAEVVAITGISVERLDIRNGVIVMRDTGEIVDVDEDELAEYRQAKTSQERVDYKRSRRTGNGAANRDELPEGKIRVEMRPPELDEMEVRPDGTWDRRTGAMVRDCMYVVPGEDAIDGEKVAHEAELSARVAAAGV